MAESMNETNALFDTSRFLPHGHCFLWEPGILWSLVGADLLIAVSYYSIPAAMLWGLSRQQRDGPWLSRVVVLFSAFIFACGTTHLIDIYTIWNPDYWLDAGAKGITGVVSAITAVALWPIVSRGSSYLHEAESSAEELAQTNRELTKTLTSLRRQQHDLHALNRMSGLMQVAAKREEIYRIAIDTLEQLLPYAGGALYVGGDARSELLGRVAGWGEVPEVEFVDRRDCWAGRLGRRFPEPSDGELACSAAGCSRSSGNQCIPLVAGGTLFGVILLARGGAGGDDTLDTYIDIVVERLCLALHSVSLREELEWQSTRDPLTGLYNRRYMDAAVELEQRRSERSGQSLGVILFDLDYLKSINDTYGHAAGDQALQHFAIVLDDHVRAGDIACRYGGEEFLVLLPDTSLEEVRAAAMRICEGLALSLREAKPRGFGRLTVSAGVSAFPCHGATVDEVIAGADQALYDAKRAGRNTVRVAPPPPAAAGEDDA
jgi:diguanylate cyclase (GGDEF)-like protein